MHIQTSNSLGQVSEIDVVDRYWLVKPCNKFHCFMQGKSCGGDLVPTGNEDYNPYYPELIWYELKCNVCGRIAFSRAHT